MLCDVSCAPQAATIGLASGASIALFDSNHPYQKNKYIQTGFRTGYCGSVTTYATWNTGEWISPSVGTTFLKAASLLHTIGL